MWRFKACPRCRGDIYLSSDYDFGVLEHCLQCGHLGFPDEVEEIEQKFPEMSLSNQKTVKGGSDEMLLSVHGQWTVGDPDII